MLPQPYLLGVPPPPLNPPGGTGWMSPYYPAPMYDTSVPTFVHHVTPPTPSAANNNGNGTVKSGNNRNSPAPPPHHMSHPPVSNSGYCQNHSPVQSVNNSAAMQQQQHVVSYHLQQGEVISLQLGDGQVEVIQGRTSIFSFYKFYQYLCTLISDHTLRIFHK